MEVEFKVESDHLSRDDPAIEAAIDKYTSALWPFGRRNKAYRKLEDEQGKLLDEQGIEKVEELSSVILKVEDVETEDDAWEVINSFKADLDQFYRNEFDLDAPMKVVLNPEKHPH